METLHSYFQCCSSRDPRLDLDVSRLRLTSLGLGLNLGLGLGLAGWNLGLEPLGLDYDTSLLKNGVQTLRLHNICFCF